MWWSNLTKLMLFFAFMMVNPSLFGCSLFTEQSSPQTEQALETQLREVLTAWRENPTQERIETLTALCAQEQGRPHSPAIQLLLADALSNAIMRPDLALPLFQQHLQTLSPEQEEAWLNALMRSQNLERLATELGSRHHLTLNPMHATARILAAQSLHNPALTWQGLLNGTHGAQLVESFYAHQTQALDWQIENPEQLVAQLVRLSESEPVTIAIARTTLATDKDPYLTPGEIPAWEHRRRIIAYAKGRTENELAAATIALTQKRSLKTLTVVIRRAEANGVRTISGFEATYRNNTLWAFNAVNPSTVKAWFSQPNAQTP